MPQELVHSGQMLRLSFREDLPLQVRECFEKSIAV